MRVDGLDQARVGGTVSLASASTRTAAHVAVRTRTVIVLDADHDAYQRLADPVTCRRRVIFVKPDYWLIVDDLDGASSHHVEVTFQFAPAMRVTLGPQSWVRAETPGGRVLWMLSVASSPVQTSLKCGETRSHSWLDFVRLRAAPTGADARLLLHRDAAVARADAAAARLGGIGVAAGRDASCTTTRVVRPASRSSHRADPCVSTIDRRRHRVSASPVPARSPLSSSRS